MEEPEHPPPHAGEHLTREDVLRLIEEHGGPEGLDLRHADLREADLSGVDLHKADLSGANLQGAMFIEAELQGTDLMAADLRWADLWDANLQGATLSSANLEGAALLGADLRGASLPDANLQEANLLGARLQGAQLEASDMRRVILAYANLEDANLEGANWGDYVLGDEIGGQLAEAASAYRALKQRHTEAGMYDVAGEFHYREMEARRKLAWKGDAARGERRRLPYALTMNALRFLYGYGERPERVIGWVVAVILGFALAHWAFGTVERGFLDALYYSAVSFTALGYGWAAEPQGWAGRFLGVGESLLGVFMMALFLVTFTRKMTR
jgi:hypothetical protein